MGTISLSLRLSCSFPHSGFISHLLVPPLSSLMNKSLCGNMQNACLWLRLLFFKNFILREEDNNSVPPGSYNTAVLIVCRAVSYKHYVCLTDAFWYQSHPCTCFISYIFFCSTILGSVSLHSKACSDHCKQKGYGQEWWLHLEMIRAEAHITEATWCTEQGCSPSACSCCIA